MAVASVATVTLFSVSANAQLALPVEVEAAPLAAGATLLYTIDLGTLPTRPALVAEVVPGPGHADMQLEIEFSNWTGTFAGGGFCQDYTDNIPYTSPVAIGPNALEQNLLACNPLPGAWAGNAVDVVVRATNFGSGTPPALVDVSIRGVTKVPTGSIYQAVDTNTANQTAFLTPVKDTVLYARTPTLSNGDGQYLWAGSDYELIGGPIIFAHTWNRLNTLMSFDLVDTLPFNAIVSNADLEMSALQLLNNGGTVTLYEAAPSSAFGSWDEGDADALGSEFIGTTSTTSAANWNYRESSSNPWTTPGGDTIGPALDAIAISRTGEFSFSSPALTAAVQGMIDSQSDDDGFVLTGPRNTFFFLDQGVRFASSTNGTRTSRPTLRVDYAAAEAHADGTLQTGVVSFIGEGEDFRWIYDLDQDDVLVTDIGGVCTVVPAFPEQPNYLPYTYTYGGPSYTGLDCCTWQIDSQATGTTGTGQALFFHNLDPFDSANYPPDSDGDGIFDNCDNCLAQPNGPQLGSCVGPAGVAGPCDSDNDCWELDTCQKGQEDADSDFAGDACSVPEPGFALGLLLGGGLIAITGRRRGRGRAAV